MNELAQMVEEIAELVSQTRSYTGKSVLNPKVMAAMGRVPREAFVPPASRSAAYYDGPLPIGYGQTISQPYIVALMTDLLEPEPGDVVLEIGTGSCYQAAVLSLLVRQVYTVEIIDELAREAEARLRRLGYANIEVCAGDGYGGWPEHAPYDGIIVTAAAPHIPEPLLAQLKPGGRLVIPVGLPYAHQELMVVERGAEGGMDIRKVLPVAFVPLTGEHGVLSGLRD
jgi:protein-L-isoaspartate(D-aspartate) O-methyltransferase